MKPAILVLDAGDVLSTAKCFEADLDRIDWQYRDDLERAARLLRAAAYRANAAASTIEGRLQADETEAVEKVKEAFGAEEL